MKSALAKARDKWLVSDQYMEDHIDEIRDSMKEKFERYCDMSDEERDEFQAMHDKMTDEMREQHDRYCSMTDEEKEQYKKALERNKND
ncbi:hypothetical protein LCGC14_1426320 [marine sediment metagenome]|uniref:Uncharacterized protein n=1 Tax=marine sediment metagenome TaxID=412755 RepID=A0A0F9JQB5_9ZZZZ